MLGPGSSPTTKSLTDPGATMSGNSTCADRRRTSGASFAAGLFGVEGAEGRLCDGTGASGNCGAEGAGAGDASRKPPR